MMSQHEWLRTQEPRNVLGDDLDRETRTPIRQKITRDC